MTSLHRPPPITSRDQWLQHPQGRIFARCAPVDLSDTQFNGANSSASVTFSA